MRTILRRRSDDRRIDLAVTCGHVRSSCGADLCLLPSGSGPSGNSIRKVAMSFPCVGNADFQGVAQGREFIDLSHDAVLFGYLNDAWPDVIQSLNRPDGRLK